ncbi:type II secretion system GspH family protein [Lachnospiraceae bacterium ZAX-1]
MLTKTIRNKLQMKKGSNNKGFSLVELIIVIAIMVILIAILAPQFIKYVERSRVSKDESGADEVLQAVTAALANEAAYAGVATGNSVTYGANGALTFTLTGTTAGQTAFIAEVADSLGSSATAIVAANGLPPFISQTHRPDTYTVLIRNGAVAGSLNAVGSPKNATGNWVAPT